MSPPAAAMKVERHLLLSEIAEFNAAYAHCIDDDQLEQWPEFFTEDCEYQIIPRENVDLGLPAAIMFCDNRGMLIDRIVALRKANIYAAHYSRHVLGAPVLLETDADGVRSQTSYVLLQTRMDGQTRVFSAGKYVDVMVRVDGLLRVHRRTVVFDTHRIDSLLVTPI
ncbi:aromatic-ring-hydroxylating dioxygenase subunit beta [Polycyclovorans algicola]|jgi:anthranilate 1,2-dioxygenase small subunit|uniref:aromatic-ring-hydroxylating dioxygenase subunit beta n=1 Tax=Polycyclovorans algicola TaxID=616992 RepID=UPI0005BC001D|nr:aromatic-ring-hydroxylating dioxygenase subunit beta [Polycyclovorans algicola]